MQSIRRLISHLLNSLQRYMRADMRYIVRGGFWVLVAQATNSILSLVLVVAFANLLPKETYGMYRYILSIGGILTMFTLTGMNNAVARAVARGHEEVLHTSILHQCKWNALMLVASWCVGGYYLVQDNTTLGLSFFILGLFVPGTLALNTYGAYLEGKKLFKIGNSLSIAATFVYSLGMLMLLMFTDHVVLLILGYALTTFLPSVAGYLYVTRVYHPPTHTSLETDETLQYGKELTLLRFLGPVFAQIDKLILWHFWGPAQLATYALATSIPNRIMLSIKSWVGIGFPKFSEKTPDEINKVFYLRIAQGMGVGALVAVVFILVVPVIFYTVLPQYADGTIYAQIFALSFIFAIPVRYISLLLTAHKYSRIQAINSILNMCIGISLYALLGSFGGIIGLIVSQVLYVFFGMIVGIVSWHLQTMHKKTTGAHTPQN